MDHPNVTLTQRQAYQFDHHYADGLPVLLADEPAPLGTGQGPSPVDLLASAVGNCLSASLLFACQRSEEHTSELQSQR